MSERRKIPEGPMFRSLSPEQQNSVRHLEMTLDEYEKENPNCSIEQLTNVLIKWSRGDKKVKNDIQTPPKVPIFQDVDETDILEMVDKTFSHSGIKPDNIEAIVTLRTALRLERYDAKTISEIALAIVRQELEINSDVSTAFLGKSIEDFFASRMDGTRLKNDKNLFLVLEEFEKLFLQNFANRDVG
ncbi:hypothetical protein H6758_03860 [Candidatus Nomurabacteria bacterium]|nr:hypothetical protein [Candidatus Nomurabacteria bacterium]